jgi:hypothetical protein
VNLVIETLQDEVGSGNLQSSALLAMVKAAIKRIKILIWSVQRCAYFDKVTQIVGQILFSATV